MPIQEVHSKVWSIYGNIFFLSQRDFLFKLLDLFLPLLSLTESVFVVKLVWYNSCLLDPVYACLPFLKQGSRDHRRAHVTAVFHPAL